MWEIVARNVIKAGVFKTPLSENITELLKTIINEQQAEFLTIFTKATLNIDEIKEKTDLEDTELNSILEELNTIGILMGIPSRRSGIMVYRLMPLFPGIFEFSFMRGDTTDKERKLSGLFDNIFDEMIPDAQKNYDRTVKAYKRLPAFDRVIPVEQEIESSVEKILPVEEVKELIEKHNIIAVARCYCRHEKDLLDKPCKLNASRDNCMFFGRFAEFFIKYKFAKQIDKEEAKKILRESENSGLVHKTFHDRLNLDMDELAICSCCKCCCGIFDLYYRGVIPIHSQTSYISKVDEEICIGCETCVEYCPTEAIEMVNSKANIDESRCIGCGVCAHKCPEEAIQLERTGLREVFIPFQKMATE